MITTTRLTWLGIALTFVLFSVSCWLEFDRPLPLALGLPILFAAVAKALIPHDPRAALNNALCGAGTAAMLVALTLIAHTEIFRTWTLRITEAMFG